MGVGRLKLVVMVFLLVAVVSADSYYENYDGERYNTYVIDENTLPNEERENPVNNVEPEYQEITTEDYKEEESNIVIISSSLTKSSGNTDTEVQQKAEIVYIGSTLEKGTSPEQPVLMKTGSAYDLISQNWALNSVPETSDSWTHLDGSDVITFGSWETWGVSTQNTGFIDAESFELIVDFTDPGCSIANPIGGILHSVLRNGSLEVVRDVIVHKENVSFFNLRFAVKNIGGSTVNDVKLFSLYDINMPNLGLYNDQSYYDYENDAIIIYDFSEYDAYAKVYANRMSSRHGFGETGSEYLGWGQFNLKTGDWNDSSLNNRDFYNSSGNTGMGLQYNLGNMVPGDEKVVDIIVELIFGNKVNRSRTLPDLTLEEKDIKMFKHGDDVNITLNVENKGEISSSGYGFRVKFVDYYEGAEIKTKYEYFSGNIVGGGSKKISTLWDIEKNHELKIVLDPYDDMMEEDEKNNYASRVYFGSNVFLDVPSSVFFDYFADKLHYYNVVDDVFSADYVIHAGNEEFNEYTLSEYDWGKDGFVRVRENHGVMPYNGMAQVFEKDGVHHLVILGNDIEGLVAASREADLYSIEDIDVYVEDDSVMALSVFEFMHNPANDPYYLVSGKEWDEIIYRALRGMYTLENLTVRTNDGKNISLRLRHIMPAMSSALRSYANISSLPVVLARGLWSGLNDWYDFGTVLAEEGRDVYLIEITGGPGQDCDTCYDYSYDDVRDTFWPSLIGGVQCYSNSSQVQYVGFSNGGRSGLDALSRWNSVGKSNVAYYEPTQGNWQLCSFEADAVETFVGVGVPGNFSTLSFFGEKLKEGGSEAIDNFRAKDKTHVTFGDLAWEIDSIVTKGVGLFMTLASIETNKISLSLLQNYTRWVNNTDDVQPGTGLSLDRFALIRGDDGPFLSKNDDFIVSVTDEDAIYSLVNSPEKYYFNVHAPHFMLESGLQMFVALPARRETKQIIKDIFNHKKIVENHPNLINKTM